MFQTLCRSRTKKSGRTKNREEKGRIVTRTRFRRPNILARLLTERWNAVRRKRLFNAPDCYRRRSLFHTILSWLIIFQLIYTLYYTGSGLNCKPCLETAPTSFSNLFYRIPDLTGNCS